MNWSDMLTLAIVLGVATFFVWRGSGTKNHKHGANCGCAPEDKTEVKKETAKVPASTPGAKVLPQATVQLIPKKSDASTSKSVSAAISIVAPSVEEGALNPIIGIAALVLALLSLAVQVWMYLG